MRTERPFSSHPHHHIAVEYVDGVGVNTCTCSGLIPSVPLQNEESSDISASVHPGCAAMK